MRLSLGRSSVKSIGMIMEILKSALEIVLSPPSLVFMVVAIPASFIIGYIAQRERHKYETKTAPSGRKIRVRKHRR
jgi:hypothetical protein